MNVWLELCVIVALVLVNGVFAGAGIAILSVRKTRLRELAAEGKRAAHALLAVRESPERFLATVQIGITVVGATAAAFGGNTLSRVLARTVERLGVRSALAEDVSLAIVIAGISYLSLVLGELVPKSIALRYAERYSLLVARPLRGLSWLARPLVWFLTSSSNAVLRLFKDETTFTEARLSKEELQQLVEEATTVGSLDQRTGDIASRALDFGDVRVGALMVPRTEMVTLSRDATHDELRRKLMTEGHARLPVCDGAPENVLGYVTARDVISLLASSESRSLADAMRPAQFVLETTRATDVLREMQRTREHLAFVVDDQGAVAGIVTLEDLLEELVGEIFDEHETPVDRIRPQPDGSALVRGRVAVHEVNRELGLELPEGPAWVTIAGLAISLVGAIPKAGTRVVAGGTTLEIVEASGHRVLTVRVVPPERPNGA